ncbi:hypothetical protein F2Q70_00003673 [Brassica cretica]|nr:hypothetical protein F2Q70_00003673 [Brassica cretica]
MIVGISGKALMVFLLSSWSYLNKIISWLYNKGTGHIFNYLDTGAQSLHDHPLREGHQQFPQRDRTSDEDAESFYSPLSIVSAPGLVSTGFYLGPSSEGRVAGNQNHGKAQRKQPQSWKRNLTGRSTVSPNHQESCAPFSSQGNMKRKSPLPLLAADNKAPKTSNPTVTSVLKPLPPK